ncbi:DUF4129 domain-containing protein [uncultured Algibacter sp.]|uniref:DUF4129 domain-containing protein n=1 Tax=uncultured Algibacter sp. TaxID=298659 RepID=UPI002630349A|nr:DUF4129 domain-containing protein [uncultured Algibacter sp.]
MNKTISLHIIIFLFSYLCFASSSEFIALDESIVITVQDSLQVDTTSISPRHFENLNDIYTGEDYIYERSVESSGWWTRFKQWLSDLFRDLFSIKNKGQASDITDIAIKIAGVIIFLLVIYFIFKAVMNDEGSWVFGKSSDKNIIPVTDVENNIHATNFKSLIIAAEKEKEYRLAVRYYYLWLLKSLTQSEIIEYDVEKTNSDYHNEISSENIKNEFAYTSYLYNYIWYGEFDVNEEQFSKAKQAFINFLNSIKA